MTMLLRHLLSILLLPTTMTVVIPYVIVLLGPGGPKKASLLAGSLVIAAGLTLVGVTTWHFATVGKGTLAPWDPPRRLVVRGIYRYMRNPMITGVILILIGEAIALRSIPVLRWAGLFFVINAVYIPLLEEQWLIDRFGDDYLEYRRNVPRWVPRRTPWQLPL
jgi:protein-S-isoprenylcysteine O-methyltransferase Ste14